jgi:hypothetical protein
MGGPEITLWKRRAIIVYRFQESLSYGQISTKLNIDRKAIASLVQRTTARSRSHNLDDLQEAVAVQSRAGRDKRAEPGDPLSQAVRKGVQRYDHHAPDRATNYYILQRQVLGELDHNIRPLGTQPVLSICESSGGEGVPRCDTQAAKTALGRVSDGRHQHLDGHPLPQARRWLGVVKDPTTSKGGRVKDDEQLRAGRTAACYFLPTTTRDP